MDRLRTSRGSSRSWLRLLRPPKDEFAELAAADRSDQASREDAAPEPKRTALPANPVIEPSSEPKTAPVEWGSLVLTVLDRDTDEPLPGLLIEVRESMPAAIGELSDVWREHAQETDREGRIEAEIRSELALVLDVKAIGVREPVGQLALEPFGPGEERELEVRVDGSLLRRFWMRIVAAEDGQPLAGARVLAVDSYGKGLEVDVDAATWLKDRELVRADVYDYASLPISPWAQKRFAALAPGRGPAVFSQARNCDTRELALVVPLAAAAELTVRVRDSQGRAQPGAEVRFEAEFAGFHPKNSDGRQYMAFGRHQAHCGTDAEGRARFTQLPAGVPFELAARTAGYGNVWHFAPKSQDGLEPGEGREVELVCWPLTRLAGTARDQFGAIAADVELLLVREESGRAGVLRFGAGGDRARRATTDERGRFAFDELPTGRYHLAPTPLRNPNSSAHFGGVERLEGLYAPVITTVELPGAAVLDMELMLWRDLYIFGRVVDEAGELVEEAYVRGTIESLDAITFMRTEQDGTFAVGPLPDSPVALYADSWELGRSPEVRCEPGDTDVELVIAGAGGLSVHTVREDTGAGVACTLRALPAAGNALPEAAHAVIMNSANWTWNGLAPGTWRILAIGPADLTGWSEPVEVRAGETTGPVELRLAPGGTVRFGRPDSRSGGVEVEVRKDSVVLFRRPVASTEPLEEVLPSGLADWIEIPVDAEPLPPVPMTIPRGGVVELTTRN